MGKSKDEEKGTEPFPARIVTSSFDGTNNKTSNDDDSKMVVSGRMASYGGDGNDTDNQRQKKEGTCVCDIIVYREIIVT